MTGNCHVRFGGRRLEKCQPSAGWLVTRWPPTLLENLHVFWPAAQAGFDQFGRGALTVDTTAQPEPDKGNPMYYVMQELVDEHFGEDEQRMVREYRPESEFVAVLLKKLDRVSSYRVGVPGQVSDGRPRRG
jgi:hypothetical protein